MAEGGNDSGSQGKVMNEKRIDQTKSEMLDQVLQQAISIQTMLEEGLRREQFHDKKKLLNEKAELLNKKADELLKKAAKANFTDK